jgi:hypothetical protein
MEDLVASGAATFKRHITVAAPDGSPQEYSPGAWLTERPWNVKIRTLHLDRLQVHNQLQQSACAHGIVTPRERAIGFEILDRRILTVETSEGHCIRSSWIIDASGAAASVLGREFSLPFAVYGPRKVALWAHFPTEDWVEGTTLYMLSPAGEYMEWIWEIPIRPGVSSLGYPCWSVGIDLLWRGACEMAEVRVSRTHRRPLRATTGFEDREDHRSLSTSYTSANTLPGKRCAQPTMVSKHKERGEAH